MNVSRKKRHMFRLVPVVLVVVVLASYSLLFVHKWIQEDRIFVGDTLCVFALYSNHYSGLARGEYAIWNPLVQAGKNVVVHQGIQLAAPISNIVAGLSVLSGVKDIVLSYSMYILVHVLLYAIGAYLLIFCWTGNRYAGALACILAVGSSTVFFSPYHVFFVQILHGIPWILYAITMYFRKFQFRYLVIFALAWNSALYSYLFVMGLSYIFMLSVAATIFYHKQALAGFYKLKKIPVWQIFVVGGLLFITICPNVLMFMDFREKLALSRITDISVTDNYTLAWQDVFHRLTGSIFSVDFWVTLFSGTFTANPSGAFRHYVGPVALPLVVVALFSLRKAAWCIAMSGLLVSMLAADLFPANLLYELPVFSQIRNGHFLLQFVVFAIIIVAGFGFDYVIRRESKKVFGTVCALMLFASLIMLFFKLNASVHNNAALLILIGSMLVVLLAINYMPLKWFAGAFLCVAAAVMVGGTLLVNHLPMSGGINAPPELMALHHRTDHSLQFRFERPLNIETISVPSVYESHFGLNEFVSLVTLKDNSFKTRGVGIGLASFPVLKSYFLFTSLPGHEEIMKRKFLFFSKCYTSREGSDMMEFMRDPDLLQGMLEGGVGMVDQVNSSDVSLGPFRVSASTDIPAVAEKSGLDVDVRRYNANSILLNVLVDKSGVLTYTDLWDKDWLVKVDGEQVPLLKVFHTFKGVELLPGRHEIEFLYKSKVIVAIIVMNIIFVVCVLGLAIGLLDLAWRDRLAGKYR